MSLFRSLLAGENGNDNINAKYGFENALYDLFASYLAGRGLLAFDPMVLVRKDVVAGIHVLNGIFA